MGGDKIVEGGERWEMGDGFACRITMCYDTEPVYTVHPPRETFPQFLSIPFPANSKTPLNPAKTKRKFFFLLLLLIRIFTMIQNSYIYPPRDFFFPFLFSEL